MLAVEDIFEKYVEDPTTLQDFLSAHAYKLKNPDAKIYKVFILYSEGPNLAKSRLLTMLASMYPEDKTLFLPRWETFNRGFMNADDLCKSFIVFDNPDVKERFRIENVATQRDFSLDGFVAINTGPELEPFFRQLPIDIRVFIRFKPQPISQKDLRRLEKAKNLAEYFKYEYINLSCPDLERWDTGLDAHMKERYHITD